MTDLLPSSRPTKTTRFFIALCLVFVLSAAGRALVPVDIIASRSENLEMMDMRSAIIGYAQNFTGLKYRYAGTSPKTGFDCSGFTSYILKEFDVKVSSSSANQSRQGMKIPLDQVIPGDLVFFGRGRGIQHVAMVVERNEEGIFVVHSTCTRGIIVENISTSKYWKPRILFARDVITPLAFMGE
jgi:hypothetical protein